MTPAVDYLALDDDALRAQSDIERTRSGGPGGQHRNKVESGVRLVHRPTGCMGQAFERRSQAQNQEVATLRLRESIALNVRRPVDLERFVPSEALRTILPGGAVRSPENPRYWAGVQQLLDLFVAAGCSVADTASLLGLSTGALSRVLLRNDGVMAEVNRLRAERGMPPLRR